MKYKLSNKIASFAVVGLSVMSVNAQTTHNWDYSWDRNVDGFPGGTDNGGKWNKISMTMGTELVDNGPIGGGSSLNNYTWVKNTSFSLDVEIGNYSYGDVDSLFMVITNNASGPDTADADWTALYFDGAGTVHAAAYANDPTTGHSFTPILSTAYSHNNGGGGAGTNTKFSLDLNATQLQSFHTGMATSFGYPFDNTGATTGNSTTPYRMGLWANSYLDGAVASGPNSGGGIDWKVRDTGRIGKIDLVDDLTPTPVPEPSSTLLLGLGSLGLIVRRKR